MNAEQYLIGSIRGEYAKGSTKLGNSQWHYAVVQGDGAHVTLWVDGDTIATIEATDLSGNGDVFAIGSSPVEPEYRPWKGKIDETRISLVQRSPDWLKLAYENQKPNQSLLGLQTLL